MRKETVIYILPISDHSKKLLNLNVLMNILILVERKGNLEQSLTSPTYRLYNLGKEVDLAEFLHLEFVLRII